MKLRHVFFTFIAATLLAVSIVILCSIAADHPPEDYSKVRELITLNLESERRLQASLALTAALEEINMRSFVFATAYPEHDNEAGYGD